MKEAREKSLKVVIVTLIFSLVTAIASYWIFEGDALFLPLLAISGIAMVIIQKERESHKFLSRLIVGAFSYGVLTEFLIALKRYLILKPMDPEFPFIYYFFNLQDAIILTLFFVFVCFLGGLVGIVIKGFYFLYKE